MLNYRYRVTLVFPEHKEWPEEDCYHDIDNATDAFNEIVEISEKKKAKRYEVTLDKIDYDPFTGSTVLVDRIKWKVKN